MPELAGELKTVVNVFDPWARDRGEYYSLQWKARGSAEGAMTRKRHTEEQIIAVLKDAQGGIGVHELCRKHGISDATFYKWRAKYAGLEVSDVKKLRQLEDENRRLKQMVAEQALDIQALKAINAKNW
jgi:putative transposase